MLRECDLYFKPHKHDFTRKIWRCTGSMMGFAYVNISDKIEHPVCLSIFVPAIFKNSV